MISKFCTLAKFGCEIASISVFFLFVLIITWELSEKKSMIFFTKFQRFIQHTVKESIQNSLVCFICTPYYFCDRSIFILFYEQQIMKWTYISSEKLFMSIITILDKHLSNIFSYGLWKISYIQQKTSDISNYTTYF